MALFLFCCVVHCAFFAYFFTGVKIPSESKPRRTLVSGLSLVSANSSGGVGNVWIPCWVFRFPSPSMDANGLCCQNGKPKVGATAVGRVKPCATLVTVLPFESGGFFGVNPGGGLVTGMVIDNGFFGVNPGGGLIAVLLESNPGGAFVTYHDFFGVAIIVFEVRFVCSDTFT